MWRICKGVLISVIFTLLAVTVFSLLLVYTSLNENTIQPVVIGITGISVLIGSCIVNRKLNKNGILNGSLIGLIYICIIYVFSSILNNMNFSLNIGAVVMIIVSIIFGAIGGIVGVNVQ